MRSATSNWTIPNALTLARILLTPLFVVFFLDGSHTAALSMFFLAGVTDALDGFLARVLDQRSKLGAMLDPIADKVLLDTAFVCLANAGWLPTWLAVIVLSRDILILGGVALLTFWGQDMRSRIEPSLVSKATTLAQMALVLGVFLQGVGWLGQGFDTALSAMEWITAGLTGISGAIYVARGVVLVKGGDNQH